MHHTQPECPIHSNGGAGHDNNFPLCILIPLVNPALNVLDKGESNGRNGPVEIYVCGVLIEMGVRKVIMKRQISCIFSTSIQSAPYRRLVLFTTQSTDCERSRAHLGPGYQSPNAWSTNWDHSHNAQYFNPKQWVQPFEESS